MEHKEYIHYTADRFLSDAYFLESELHPTKESRLFWKALETKDETLAKEIETARFILASVKHYGSGKPLSPVCEDELWTRIESINRQWDKWRRRRVMALAAAVVAALAFWGIWTWGFSEPETDYLAILQSTPLEEAASGNIQLVLSDKQRLSFDSKEAEIDYQNEGEILVNTEKIDIEEERNKQKAFNQLIVPKGRRSSLSFADGTKIWVNSDSKVIYPLQFSTDKREIFVEGEVYLKVASLANVPFIVKTKRMDITVLGTQFNVSAYENEPQLNVILVSGKVEVKTEENKKKILTSHQRFSYNTLTHETRVDSVDVDYYIAWKEGYYPFRQESLDVVLNKLIKYYGAEMEWDAGIAALTCSGKLDLKEELRDVLKVLAKAAPIEIEENEAHIYIHVKPQK
ncbi:MAG: FecR family protein [Tannerellaceae bacterium]|nr:FecR family protein [Tannerellaceae bacterium]